MSEKVELTKEEYKLIVPLVENWLAAIESDFRYYQWQNYPKEAIEASQENVAEWKAILDKLVKLGGVENGTV